MTVTLNGSDPTIYLTNGTRIMLGLEGESTRTASVVQAAQDAFYAKTGVWPDVDGMPNKEAPQRLIQPSEHSPLRGLI